MNTAYLIALKYKGNNGTLEIAKKDLYRRYIAFLAVLGNCPVTFGESDTIILSQGTLWEPRLGADNSFFLNTDPAKEIIVIQEINRPALLTYSTPNSFNLTYDSAKLWYPSGGKFSRLTPPVFS